MELEDAGLQVIEAASGDEAVSMLVAGTLVRAVITDVRMPGQIDGFGLVRWLNKHRPEVPVIITSEHPIDLENADMRATAVVRKPYDASGIVAQLGLPS